MSKKVYKFKFEYIQPLIWPFWTLLVFLRFYLDPWGVRSLVACRKHVHWHSIIKNSFLWKFPILNQCVRERSTRSDAFPIKRFTYILTGGRMYGQRERVSWNIILYVTHKFQFSTSFSELWWKFFKFSFQLSFDGFFSFRWNMT